MFRNYTTGNPKFSVSRHDTYYHSYKNLPGVVWSCGGDIPSRRVKWFSTKKCYFLDGERGSQWKEMTPILHQHDKYSSEVVWIPERGVWLLPCTDGSPYGGGCQMRTSSPMKSEIFINNTWIPGPQLPVYNESSFTKFPVSRCNCAAQCHPHHDHRRLSGSLLQSWCLAVRLDWRGVEQGPQPQLCQESTCAYPLAREKL